MITDYRAFLSDVDAVRSMYNNLAGKDGQEYKVEIKGNEAEFTSDKGKYTLKGEKQTIDLLKDVIGNKDTVTFTDIEKFMKEYAEGFIVYVLVEFPKRWLNGKEEIEDGRTIIKEIIRTISKAKGTYEDIVKAVDEYLHRLQQNLEVLNTEHSGMQFNTARNVLHEYDYMFYWVEIENKKICKEMDKLQKRVYK